MNPLKLIYQVLTIALKPFIFASSVAVPRDEDTWVFMAGQGDRFADNSKYLFLDCEDRSEIRNVWISVDTDIVTELRNNGYEAYSAGSIAGKWTLLRAGYWFETHGPIVPEYSGRAKLIHLTHGNYLKVMLNDHTRDWPWIVQWLVEICFERRRRYVVTGSGPPLENMQSMRDVPASRALVTGLPRNDALFETVPNEQIGLNEDALEEFRQRSADGPVLLYAPTYREGYGEQNGVPLSELELGLSDLDEVLITHNATLYISHHPAAEFDRDMSELKNVKLLDSGGDLYPFLRSCDVLVTDYSGIFYDFLLLNRPIVFYAPDLDDYLADRDLYFNYEEHVPGPIAKTPETFIETIEMILNGDDRFEADREAIRKLFYDNKDGIAAERLFRSLN